MRILEWLLSIADSAAWWALERCHRRRPRPLTPRDRAVMWRVNHPEQPACRRLREWCDEQAVDARRQVEELKRLYRMEAR